MKEWPTRQEYRKDSFDVCLNGKVSIHHASGKVEGPLPRSQIKVGPHLMGVRVEVRVQHVEVR